MSLAPTNGTGRQIVSEHRFRHLSKPGVQPEGAIGRRIRKLVGEHSAGAPEYWQTCVVGSRQYLQERVGGWQGLTPSHQSSSQKGIRVMIGKDAHAPDAEVFDMLGPTFHYVTPLSDADGGYCVLKGTVPRGVVVPIHSHADRETFYILAGALEALKGDRWQTFGAGDVFDVPGGTKHAFRNVSAESVSILIVTTIAMGRFFQRVGRPIANVSPGPPSKEVLQWFAQASLAEGHWLGNAADNAAVGVTLLSFN